MVELRDPLTGRDDPPGPGEGLALERLIFFSDAVFAIALTLLALDLRVPDIPAALVATDLSRTLLDLWPRVVGFVISFAVIAAFWRGHHRMFRYILRADEGLIRRNFLLLFCVVVLPFPTSVIGRYGDTATAVIFYALSIAATGAASWFVWRYATRGRRLVAPDLDAALIGATSVRVLALVGVFLASIPIAFVSPYLAEMSWALTAVVLPLAQRRYRARPATATS